jgi:hypothetical protein
MSSILKALRKIDEEKRETKQAAPDLRIDQGFAPFKTYPLLLVSAGVVAGAVLVGLFFIWTSDKPAAVVFSQPVLKTEQVNFPRQSLPETSPVVEIPIVTLQPEPVARIDKLTDAIEPSPVTKVVASTPVAVHVPDQYKTSKSATSALDPSIMIQPRAAPDKGAVSPVVSAELPDGVSLLVTDIFFQDDSANSMAVVNDLPVMVGTHVDSAVVTEIRPDSVLFSIGGVTYTLSATTP